MAKHKYVGEFEFNASKKILYLYFSTPSELSRWFADDVKVNNEDKVYTFVWNGEETKAKLTSSRTNHHVRFDIIDDDSDDNNYFEFKIDMNELTQAVYVRITDYSDMDEKEAHQLWELLIHDLKEIIGG